MKFSYLKLTPFIIAGALLLVACEDANENGENNQERVRVIPVETVEIVKDSFEDFIRLSGVAEAIEDAVISSESSGRIMEIVPLGTELKKGETIARMDDRLMRASFEAAKTTFNLADDTFRRLSVLYADSIISTQDFDAARAQRDQAKAQLDQVTKQLEDAVITAPFTGRVEERLVRTGELINPGMPVVRLINTDRIKVKAGVPERFSGEISAGTPVRLTTRTNQSAVYESNITFAGNLIDPDTRTFNIEIELRNKDGILKPEMVIDIRAKRATIENAAIIPRTAIVRDEHAVSVYVSRTSGEYKVAELVEVKTGTASGPVVEILSGLQEGDEVVIAGMSNLSPGDRLNVIRTNSSPEYARELQLRVGRTASN